MLTDSEINYTAKFGEVLGPIVERVHGRAVRLGLMRIRGGVSRDNWWAEIAGRPTAQGPTAGWVEIRLHHRPSQGLLQMGALLYEPLSRGGRTRVLTETSRPIEEPLAIVHAIEAAFDSIEMDDLRARRDG